MSRQAGEVGNNVSQRESTALACGPDAEMQLREVFRTPEGNLY